MQGLITIEKQAKTLLNQRKTQEGLFTSQIDAERSFYKKMYYFCRAHMVNLFKDEPTDVTELQDANRQLIDKCKAQSDTIISLTHQKKQLQGACISLQEDAKRMRDEIVLLKRKSKRK